ncbi:hypothetical protein M426DRAFT_163798 [Hypoxylon sp. CI-4A]|nr:hypothetical protein M426DRAFT_163798 [Hypoxylon sp. CI-4A]
MHNSSCPKCGTAFAGDSKTCGSCGAVSGTHYPTFTYTWNFSSIFLVLEFTILHPLSSSTSLSLSLYPHRTQISQSNECQLTNPQTCPV